MKEFCDTHQGIIDNTTEESCERTNDDSDANCNYGGTDAHQEGYSRAEEDLGENIAAKVVSAKGMV